MNNPGQVPARERAGPFLCAGAFTLVELLIAVTVIAILAALLLPALARSKEQGRRAKCISNLRQLQLGWQMYADDFGGVLCPNDWIADDSTGNSTDLEQTSWSQGDARTDTDTSGIQTGLLYPYNESAGIYHCPSDMSTIQDAKGVPLSQPRTRSYNMSQSVNGYGLLRYPTDGYYVDVVQPCFQKLSAITNPLPSKLFVFIDENEVTLQDDQFGYPMLNNGYGQWWDMPSNRHDQGADLSFADGHGERWSWAIPMIDPEPTGSPVTVPPVQMADYVRVGNAMRQIPFERGPPPGIPR